MKAAITCICVWPPEVGYVASRSFQMGLRGIYVPYNGYVERGKKRYDVRYVGMSAGKRFAIKGRLRSHIKSKRKGNE